MGPFGGRRDENWILEEAASRLRGALGSAVLLPATRERILARAVRDRGSAETAVVRKFAPGFGLALAASVPALVIGAAALILALREQAPQSPKFGGIVGARKVGDQIVFTIANGNRPHVVYRSKDPARFDQGSAERVVGGRFEDRVGEEPGIVFYRVE